MGRFSRTQAHAGEDPRLYRHAANGIDNRAVLIATLALRARECQQLTQCPELPSYCSNFETMKCIFCAYHFIELKISSVVSQTASTLAFPTTESIDHETFAR
jgi:hypothetical protein